MEPDRRLEIMALRKLENSPRMLQSVGLWKPPAPEPRERTLGVFALLRALATNQLEAWTVAHFEQPLVSGGLPFARVVVVSEPGAIRRVLL